MGGIGTLPMDYGQSLQVPQQMQPSFSSAQNITMNPLLNYGQTPLTMAGGGSANLVPREQYGLGSVLKKFAKTFIPKELDPVLQIAAPFLGPVYGPIASVAGSARTGKINPLSLAASTLPYLQFGGVEGATGLQSLMPTGYGGSGALGQFLPGGDFQIGSGTNLATKLSEFMKVGTPSSTGNISFEMGPDGLKLPGTTISDALSTKSMGTGDLFKTIFSPESGVDLGTRARAAADLTGSAIKAMYTNADGSVDKKMVISTIAAVPSYLDAKKKAQEAGLTDNEFNERIYNEEKQFYANRYASNAPASSFDIRTTAAGGGMMDDGSGILSIKLTPAQGMAMGGEIPVRQNQGGISELDLRAKGGYIPVGIKEKADDVPAMLSKNEFVFTADAVRGAGNGSVNKGAQKMYKLMKSLEKKVKKIKVA
jgi:hypothetical protein